ncbi:MAG: formyl transferase [Thermoanaerobaculia bacterium]|nr:formyl transferase [Thermoanaerobaculia bacterium]
MRVVTLTCPGPTQAHLARRLSGEFDLVGCVIRVEPPESRRARLRRLAAAGMDPHGLLLHLEARAECARREAEAAPAFRGLFPPDGSETSFPSGPPRLEVSDVNSAEAVDFVRGLAPDAVVVNGTNLLRAPMLSLASGITHGFVNVHTGLSPYSRGGNCNLHCILHRQPQAVGVTVHHIDAGVDSGDIVATGRPRLEVGDTIETIDAKTFRLGEDLLVASLLDLEEGVAPRVRQWEPGRLFLRRTGYSYSPALRVRANELLESEGLVSQYHAFRRNYDERIVLVASARAAAILPDTGCARII